MLQAQFQDAFCVHQYECDMQNRLSPGAALRRVQQISTGHCTAHGLTEQVYLDTHTVFLLAKTELVFHQPILVNTSITLITEAYAPVRASFLRKVSFCDAHGETLAQAHSVWVLVDTNTRRIMRRPPDDIARFFAQNEAKAADISIEKTADILPVADITARYTMCDQNGHINNTVYADILCDTTDAALFAHTYLQKAVIAYHSEVPLGKRFTVNRGALSDTAFYYSGISDAANHFEANLYFA